VKHQMIRPQFVESAPSQMSEGVIYISDRFRTALHKCCCGCGKEVVTPLNPAGWSYTRDAGTVTFKPSIGNWSFPCKSHYLIIRNEVVWASALSARQIAAVKTRDARDQQAYIARSSQEKITTKQIPLVKSSPSIFSLIRDAMRAWWSSK
jgi:hypothetical protein